MKSMQCPSCPSAAAALVVVERQGIEIDYCPVCRGVWLDRGELDKLIDRPAARETADAGSRPSHDHGRHDDRRQARGDRRGRDRAWVDDDDRDETGPGRRRPGILGELFDF